MPAPDPTRRTVLASTVSVFGSSLVGAASASETDTRTARSGIQPYPAGEAPEPDPAWVADHEDATTEWVEAADELAPDEEFVWLHTADASKLAGVQITYVELVAFAEQVIEIAIADDVEDVTAAIDGADEAYYYAGFGLANHLYVRDANALIDVRAARQGPDGSTRPAWRRRSWSPRRCLRGSTQTAMTTRPTMTTRAGSRRRKAERKRTLEVGNADGDVIEIDDVECHIGCPPRTELRVRGGLRRSGIPGLTRPSRRLPSGGRHGGPSSAPA